MARPSGLATATRRVASDRRGDRELRKGDRQRQAVLDAVNKLLADTAIADLSVAQITAEAGLTRSGFYFYFDTKYAALAAAVAEVFEELDIATEHLARADDELLVVWMRRALTSGRDIWRIHAALLDACMQARDNDPVIHEMWDLLLASLEYWVSEVVRDELRPDLSTTELRERVRLLLGMSIWAVHEDSTSRASVARSNRTIDTLVAVWHGAFVRSTPGNA